MAAEILTPASMRVCIEKRLPPELEQQATEYAIQQNRANLPSGVDVKSVDPKTLAIQVGKKWPMPADGGPVVLRVKFLEGDPVVRQKVMAQAKQLEQWAHVRFDVVTSGVAEIRIGFDTRDGSWSTVGLDANFVPQDQRTMNFGWLYPNTSTADYSAVVKHEFLHALGAIHEHQSPGATINWNVPKVYQVYGAPPNSWDKRTIDDNVLTKYSTAGMAWTPFDPYSIMLYPVDSALTTDGFGSGYNTDLSATDRQFLATHYPKPNVPAPPVPTPPPTPTPPPIPPPTPTPPPGPAPSYIQLVLGGRPIYGDTIPSGSKPYKLTLDHPARYFIGTTRITGVGGLLLEIHKGTYPSSLRMTRPMSITGPMQPGDFYIVIKPVDQTRGAGRFAIAARQVGR